MGFDESDNILMEDGTPSLKPRHWIDATLKVGSGERLRGALPTVPQT